MPGFYLPSENEFDPSFDDLVLPELAKERRYQHFDLPLSEVERGLNIDFSNESKPHRFWPLLGFTEEVRRYARNSEGEREQKIKEREIRFAGHQDAAYLQAYSGYLSNFYEQALDADGTAGSVLAYRKGSGTNIDHAKSLFDEISERRDCAVFAMDISGFFDCLDHIILRNEIAGLLNETRLEGHHGTVWKNVTKYSWVETIDLDTILGSKRNGQGRVCSSIDFVKHVQGRKHGLIRKHDMTCGIPQGTPVSGMYANIYLRTFDREMLSQCKRFGGSYRRYSDDIAVVLPLGAKAHHVVTIVEKMLADFGLAMSMNKVDTANFFNGVLISSTPIQYLGFTFDGSEILIRQSSLDAYRRKMRTGIHAKLVAAKMQNISSSKVFRREPLSRYTHLGKRRNFIKYAYKAAEVMRSPKIKQQVKPHMTWFNRAWEKESIKVFGH